MAALLTVLEGLVASGHTQYYGIECAQFTVAEGAAAADAPPAQPLRPIFELAEALVGRAAQERKKIVDRLVAAGVAPAALPLMLGNTVARRGPGVLPLPALDPSLSQPAEPATPHSPTDAVASGAPDSEVPGGSPALQQPHSDGPLPEDHHLACISYPLNLGAADALLPLVLDRQGK